MNTVNLFLFDFQTSVYQLRCGLDLSFEVPLIRVELVFHVVCVWIQHHKRVFFILNFGKRVRPACSHASFENGRLVLASLDLLGVIGTVPFFEFSL